MSAIKSHVHACFDCQVPLTSPVMDTRWSQCFGVDTSKAVYWDAMFCKSAANLFEFHLFELNNSWIPGRHQEVPPIIITGGKELCVVAFCPLLL